MIIIATKSMFNYLLQFSFSPQFLVFTMCNIYVTLNIWNIIIMVVFYIIINKLYDDTKFHRDERCNKFATS